MLVLLITRDDARQVPAAEEFVETGAWVSHLALAEATSVLETVDERTAIDIARVVEILLDHRDLSRQDSEVVAAALGRFKARPAVGFSDCLLLEIARKAGHGPLGTFDRDLDKLEGAERLR